MDLPGVKKERSNLLVLVVIIKSAPLIKFIEASILEQLINVSACSVYTIVNYDSSI